MKLRILRLGPIGIHCLYGHGCVRGIRYEIDLVMLNRLGQRDDGETLEAGSF